MGATVESVEKADKKILWTAVEDLLKRFPKTEKVRGRGELRGMLVTQMWWTLEKKNTRKNKKTFIYWGHVKVVVQNSIRYREGGLS